MRLTLPTQGVYAAGAVADTPTGFAPLGTQLNVAAFTGADGRRQLGRRPGLRPLLDVTLGRPGSRRVTGLIAASRGSAVTSYQLGPLTPVSVADPASGGRRAGLVQANAWIYTAADLRDTVRVFGSSGAARLTLGSQPAERGLAGIAAGFPTATGPSFIVPHPGGSVVAIGYNYLASGQQRVLVVIVDARRGRLVGARRIAPASEGSENNVEALAAACTQTAVWVARGRRLWKIPLATAGDGTRVTIATSGDEADLDPLELNTPLGAAAVPGLGRVVALAAVVFEGRDRLYAAFEGATDAGSFANPSGSIASGATARHFRAGVCALEVGLGGVSGLSLVSIGLPAVGADPYVEVDGGGQAIDHRSVRFSRLLDRGPRGALPAAIAADARDGSFVVAFTQRGWGPTTSFPPDTERPPTVLARFDANGQKLWEVDADSVISGERGGKRTGVATTYPCDVPDEDGANAGTTTHAGPAIRALAIAPSGLIVAAGRINSGRFNVFAFDPGAGTLRWRQRTEGRNPTSSSPTWPAPGDSGGGSPRGSVAFESESVVWIAGRRNASWTAADYTAPTYVAPWAHAWRLATADGAVLTGLSPVNDEVGAADVADLAPRGLAVLGSPTPLAVVASGEFTDS